MCSGASEWGASERTKGLRRWGFCGARARDRGGSGALPGASHSGGEGAAAELDLVAWQGEEGSSAERSGAKGSRRCRVWRWGSRSWPAALLGGGRRRSALAAEKQGGREVEDEGWTILQFLKIPGILL